MPPLTGIGKLLNAREVVCNTGHTLSSGRADERGFFIPKPIAGATAPQSSDVDTGPDDLICLLDCVHGFDILEFSG